jgi:hypothetical protein
MSSYVLSDFTAAERISCEHTSRPMESLLENLEATHDSMHGSITYIGSN